MASFEKRGKKWRAVVSVMEAGARKKVSKTFTLKREAEAWATEMESDRNKGVVLVESDMLLADYFQKWYEQYRKPDIRASTTNTYHTQVYRLNKYFGDVRLNNMSSALLQERFNEFAKDVSYSGVTTLLTRLKAALNDAILDGYVRKNVWSRLKNRAEFSEKKLKFMSATDFKKLQNYLYAHINDDERNLMILTALETGARQGEVLALTPSDVQDDMISITKSFSQYNMEVTLPKTKESVRTITISHRLQNVLLEHSYNDQQIFRHCRNGYIAFQLRKVLKELAIPDVSYHALRHSHVSFLLYNGVALEYVSKRIGHKNPKITLEVYAHLLKEREINESEKTIELLNE
ncbi:tyrosine-type recombinase/integrase [Periweissella fabaria]|uniref:Tyrosine recombinase XerC n=1 Tax=Periweissella fabaria TaxID=546157 RepID=A0ABN8BL84_9LACO|nr:site-specific integrase [Periweissella fabaria]MCM0597345.1 tyrosine-type recombinase/integrase [Periweissella fabaria]CAH0416152.1 Tyrosine recombinase XerC [Periweissella fabaria]